MGFGWVVAWIAWVWLIGLRACCCVARLSHWSNHTVHSIRTGRLHLLCVPLQRAREGNGVAVGLHAGECAASEVVTRLHPPTHPPTHSSVHPSIHPSIHPSPRRSPSLWPTACTTRTSCQKSRAPTTCLWVSSSRAHEVKHAWCACVVQV